jgi:predicted DNA-binding protein
MTFSMRLPEEIETRLNKLSHDTGRTRAFYMLELLKENLTALENKYNKQQQQQQQQPEAES